MRGKLGHTSGSIAMRFMIGLGTVMALKPARNQREGAQRARDRSLRGGVGPGSEIRPPAAYPVGGGISRCVGGSPGS